jgi:hypothetical protein
MFFDPDPKYEKPINDIDHASLVNWNSIPKDARSRCIGILRSKTPPDMLSRWKDQHARKIRIGSDDPWFHLGIGMQIRNALRSVLLDQDLPPVKYEDGNEYKNWDDFYHGALQEFVSEPEDILFSPIGGQNGR